VPRMLGVAGLFLVMALAPGFARAAQPAAPAPAQGQARPDAPPAQGAPAAQDQKKGDQKKDDKAKQETPAAVEARLSDQLLLELEKKRREIDRRETELRREESRLQELRADIKKRIDTLQEVEQRIQKALEKTESTKDDRLEHLVRAYTAMAPDAAANLLNTLDITLAVQILRNMQVKRAGAILAVVQPERAAKISELLARQPQPPAEAPPQRR